MNKLNPEEELQQLKKLYSEQDYIEKILNQMAAAFNILQVRSQMILGLITVCLMISGFSGERIAASGKLESALIISGVLLVLLSGVILFRGPLTLNWMTAIPNIQEDESLQKLIEIRNLRTRKYHLAIKLLLCGLSLYVLSLALFIASGI
ncbi:hypothetical protein PQO03_09730 [Lentisphaera profundi]|uniref:Uncharacterized protein n=1 Tax=Lentisphaera profundi TaxID=1658616 RepID=A0ABY7VS00_9BACT|nr:hypothetical protein [Lentisphaera profundi]WDE95993.1 hypothetical protein PQO03_09730 [Lentisphaera profundi]